MKPRSFFQICAVIVLLVPGAMTGFQAGAAQGWNGALASFAVPAGADWQQASNQDRLTPSVWLTRANTRGLFNVASENSYASFFSPSNTVWAFGALADFATLTYASWEAWNGHNPPSMVGQDAVLHLVSDDIYLSINFTSWGVRTGGFAYLRSTPVGIPEPTVAALVLSGLGLLLLAQLGRGVLIARPRQTGGEIRNKPRTKPE